MKKFYFLLITLIWTSFACQLYAQNPDIQLVANLDSFCIQSGESIQDNVGLNDILPPPGFGFGPGFSLFGTIPPTTGTINLTDDGDLFFTPAEGFCGEIFIEYRVDWNDGGDIFLQSFGLIQIEVKCDAKPDCALVDLSPFLTGEPMDPTGQGQPCIDACELSDAIYFVPYDSNKDYTWDVSGGVDLPGANPAEILVQWGGSGSGIIVLTIEDLTTGAINEITICVDLLEKPIAAFSVLDICIGQDAEFMDQSTGATAWFWDFGDGFTSDMQNPVHTYASSGTYPVTLIVTKANLDQEGNALCCCTDTLTQDINVDNLPGPSIECVSTVCAGETQVYSTDADCTTLDWTVLDANGDPYPFTVIPPNSIEVVWGNGPTGTVILDVDNCTTAYCPLPTTVTIPIIGPTAGIYGPTEVCAFETATYNTDKYHGTTYAWSIPDGSGTIVSDATSNVVTVTWGAGPIGNLELDIYSDFLGCGANGSLAVDIKPELVIFGQTNFCVGDFANFSSNHPGNLTWSIDFPGSSPFVGTSVSGNIGLPEGTYKLTAVPDDPTLYCNDSTCVFFTVHEVPPPTAIDGPLDVCPGETYYYYAQSTETGVQFNWTITGSTTGTSFTGNPLEVIFDGSGVYQIELTQSQIDAPFCNSDPIVINPSLQQLPPITVSLTDGCVNQITSYSATNVPDATYDWVLSDPSAGSIIGQGNSNIDIQWNDQTVPGLTLTVTITLCNTFTQTYPITIYDPAPPVIFQTGNLCPGVPATLDAPAGYSSYQWSNGGTTNQISITDGGFYHLTVTDPSNGGCPVIASFEAIELEGPTAQITALNPKRICINSPTASPVTLAAFNGVPAYSYTWYCNGSAQAVPPLQDQFTHAVTTAVGNFTYFAVVTDQNGCQATSNSIVVEQVNCTGGPGGCTPAGLYFHNFNSTQGGFCNEVDFNVLSLGVSSFSWDFDDSFGNSFTGPVTNPTHTYTEAGCYNVFLDGLVPAVGGGFCQVTTTRNVCVPVAANFDYSTSCDEVSFTDLSTFLSAADAITGYSWNFGPNATPSTDATGTPPVITFSTAGPQTITLTVTSLNGCTAQITKTVNVAGLPNPPLTLSAGPYCVGAPIVFDASGPGLISWDWNFGDGTSNGSNNPTKTYLISGPQNISLTVVDDQGCENTLVTSINVFPEPVIGTITDTGLELCEGETTTLTAPSGFSYLWNTGATDASINVTTAGMYDVEVTDTNGCAYTTDAVEVIVFPLPVAQINGPNIICDNDCITLSATPGTGYQYKWFDGASTQVSSTQNLVLCGTAFISPYTLSVLDLNGCEALSDPFDINHGISPTPNISVSPTPACEGTLTTLSVDLPHTADYTWSTGDVGPTITVTQAGAYTVIATDPVTGCIGSDTEVVNPLPDLCLVPVGCYERCPGDTICGPTGLDFYQWNFNGNPMLGENSACLVVNNTGEYTLTAMNEFGCETTSGILEITVVPCDDPCEMVDVTAEPYQVDTEDCCWVIDLENGMADTIVGIRIDALGGIDLGYQGSPAGWSQIGASTSHVELIPTTSPYVPVGNGTGILNDVAAFCLGGYTVSPQEVVISWLFEDPSSSLGYSIPCTDTLAFECTPPIDSSGCLTIVNDSIYCEGDSVKYTFFLENTALAGYSFQSIAFNIDTSEAIIVDPDPITFPPIAPGQTAGPFTVCLTGPDLIPGGDFKFTITSHDTPITADFEPLFCCTDGVEYCIPVPICDPCEFVSASVVKDSTDCCWNITLDNQYDPNYFTGISTEIITPGATFGTIGSSFGLGWTYAPISTTELIWSRLPFGSDVPLGTTDLPTICLDGNYPDSTELVISWLAEGFVMADSVICTDTLLLVCEPAPDTIDCAGLINEHIYCDSDGNIVYEFQLVNNSGYDIDQFDFNQVSPTGITFNPDPFSVSVPDTDTSGLLTVIVGGSNALPGTEVCFKVTVHDLLASGNYFECCTSELEYCFTIPDCGQDPTLCTSDMANYDFRSIPFQTSVIVDVLTNDVPCDNGTLIPASVNILSGPSNGNIVFINPANGAIGYSPNPGYSGGDSFIYEVCCTDGQCCSALVEIKVGEPLIQTQTDAKPIFPKGEEDVDDSMGWNLGSGNNTGSATPPIQGVLRPNPTANVTVLDLKVLNDQIARLNVYNNMGQLVMDQEVNLQEGNQIIPVDLARFPDGVYQVFLITQDDRQSWKAVKVSP